MPAFRILPGLPPYGPPPEAFSPTGQGTHQEGLVVEFEAAGGSWVGNFQRGGTRFDSVLQAPGGGHLLVLAGGTAYCIEPQSRRCLRMIDSNIEGAWRVSDDRLILSNGLWLEAIGPEAHTLWRTRRISWDGVSEVTVTAERVTGLAYDPMVDTSVPFSVEVETGEATGGSYPAELG